ncbi:Dual specificity protein kinase lkh1 [Trametes pubescens]|uniref:Dual specificity protein kinase lkh1 n=1 Tax=Trametes pubescens TaxID=154538 RepID=A0A1M2V9E4_TRAPU|nr:Dual specificity protein kinase lkh1 [Trametes pubescens]
MPKPPSRSPFNFSAHLARSPTRPLLTPPRLQTGRPPSASVTSASILRPDAVLRTTSASARHFASGLNASPPPQTTDPAFDPHRTAFHEEPYTLSPEDGPYGFFPMRLGQKLCDGKYKVVRKLGYGAYSSVWLARETMCVLLHSSYPGAHYRSAFSRPDGHRYVAIKVLSVFSTNIEYRKLYYEFAVAESMSTFQRSDLAHPGYQHCAIIKRTFMEDSAHDVKLANVLVELDTSTEQIDRFLLNDRPQIYADSPPTDPRISPHPIPAIRSQRLPNFGLDPSYENLHIRLIDYGNAIRADDIRPDTHICTPSELCAPEMLLGHAWSYPVEVWAVGCMIFQLLTRQDAFPFRTEDERIAFIYDCLGPYPMEFVRRCSTGQQRIDHRGIPLGIKHRVGDQGTLETRFATLCDGLSAQDIGDTCRFLRKCLTIDPLARPTVSQLLQDAWLAT